MKVFKWIQISVDVVLMCGDAFFVNRRAEDYNVLLSGMFLMECDTAIKMVGHRHSLGI